MGELVRPLPRLTVVVPTWNRATVLAGCLESLVSQSLSPELFEVVVADDGSTDATGRVVTEFADRAVAIRHVAFPHDGLNSARNHGVRAATGEVIAFVDDDEVAPVTHLEAILAGLDANPDVDGIGGPYREQETPGRSRTCGRCTLGAATIHASRPDGRARALLGGNMAIRTSAFSRVGLFDEELSGRGDESEWFSRARASFLFDPDLFVWHRKDPFTLVELCKIQFTQGRGLARSAKKRGSSRNPRVVRMGRTLGHGVTRRCAHGYLSFARELGSSVEWVRLRVRRDRSAPLHH
jgi:glycosyltransferase involved in cell wall biosynthesis